MSSVSISQKLPPGLAAFCSRWGKELGVVLALLVTLAAPWVLKPKESTAGSHYDRRLVIITPHNQKIRQEFSTAFARYWREKTGEKLNIDWRVQGTSEISIYLRSEYSAAFEQFWTQKLGKAWTREIAMAFANGKLAMPVAGEKPTAAQEARKMFLESNTGVGIDLFFGGGSYDFQKQSSAGFLVSAAHDGKNGVGELFAKHGPWFTDAVIPSSVSGEDFYDKEKRWVGSCLSSMGIVFNRDALKRLGVTSEPTQWKDLANPLLAGQVALSDPNKSGTVTKALEQIIQQQMQMAIDEVKKNPKQFQTAKEQVAEGLNIGWERGLQLILRICANARYFTDAATKIPLEVSQGDAAAGMCIDYYGRSFEEQVRKPDGTTRVGYVTPVGGSSVGVDPVGMLRGAPEPELATAFMEFVLSDEGQKIWNYRPGSPGGPENAALRRLPVRRDFYTEANRQYMADAALRPFDEAKAFTYHPEWTMPLFDVIRFLVRVMCIDLHEEQRESWRILAQANFPPRATAMFEDVKLVNYQSALNLAAELKRNDKEQEVKKSRELSSVFRGQYDKSRELARRGQ
ncbi:MAG: extracellular solute-binding protein [Verrucomicrobiaceae bacterium]